MVLESQRDTKFFIANYQSRQCVCGQRKGVELSFCYDCFKVLPYRLRDGLKGALSDEDYQYTWNQSYQYLVGEGRI